MSWSTALAMMASSSQDWSDALMTLHDQPELRKTFGKAGREKTEQEYSLQIAAPRLLDILRSAV